MARALRSSIAALALVAVVVGGVSCRSSQDPAASLRPQLNASSETTASASGATTSVDPVPGAVADPAAAPSLNATQAKALEAELKAIERELDQLDLPSDSDFSGIESELP